MIEATRGSLIHFYDWQFRDIDKQPTVPEAACLRISYQKRGCKTIDEVTLVQSGGLWSGAWDSSDADAGTIYWHIRSTSPEAIAAEGELRLRANPANGDCSCSN